MNCFLTSPQPPTVVRPLQGKNIECYVTKDSFNGMTSDLCSRYDPESARFEDIPDTEVSDEETDKIKFCASCIRIKENELVSWPYN